MARYTALPVLAQAFLDAIAIGESGGADDDMAYSVLFGGTHFGTLETGSNDDPVMIAGGWDKFPQWPGVWIDGVPTHAAGRYQFEPGTWDEMGGGPFTPERQDLLAWQLAQKRCGPSLAADLAAAAAIGTDDALTDAQISTLSDIADVLKPTWASLDPATFPQRFIDCYDRLNP